MIFITFFRYQYEYTEYEHRVELVTTTRFKVFTKLKTQLKSYIVQKHKIKTKLEYTCCDGYLRTAEKCVPICDYGCGSNGYCSSPQFCSCNSGYEWDYNATVLKCIPICKFGCVHGLCTAPDECKCFEGYTLDLEKR